MTILRDPIWIPGHIPKFDKQCSTLSLFIVSLSLFFSPSKAKNRGSQQVRGKVPENESLVKNSDQTTGGGVEEKPGDEDFCVFKSCHPKNYTAAWNCDKDKFKRVLFCLLQAGVAPPDLNALRSQITALEEEREENLWKVEQYEELRATNGKEFNSFS